MTGGMRGVLCVLLTLAPAALAEESANDVIDRVRAKYDAIVDAEVRFTQRIRFPGSRIDQTADGLLLMKKEHRFRIELEQQTIVTDGETVWSHSATLNQVLIDRFSADARSLSPDRILRGDGANMPAMIVGHEKLGKTGVVVVKMISKDAGTMVKSLKLWISESDWLVRRAEVIDGSGRETVYQVSGITINSGIPDSRFLFRIPDGAEVVDLR